MCVTVIKSHFWFGMEANYYYHKSHYAHTIFIKQRDSDNKNFAFYLKNEL